jgi:hypothetical protein
MKKTAVNYLINEISQILGKIETSPMQDLFMVDALTKAKEKEKQQLKDAYFAHRDFDSGGVNNETFEEWYDEFLNLNQ